MVADEKGKILSPFRPPYGNSLLKVCTTEERNKKLPLTNSMRWRKGIIENRSASERNSLEVKEIKINDIFQITTKLRSIVISMMANTENPMLRMAYIL